MKKHILRGALTTLLGLSTISCSDFLDVPPHNSISDVAVWENLDLAEAFLNNCYTYVIGENNSDEWGGTPWYIYTDEVMQNSPYNYGWIHGEVTNDNYAMRNDFWGYHYSAIQKVNQLLENIETVPTKESQTKQKEQIIGQAYFLRAYFYMELYSIFGRIPLVDHTFEIKSTWAETRANMDDVAAFIIEDCERAAEKLPLVYEDAASDFGRATRVAALAVKARTLLYKASALFSEGSTEASEDKWKAAADAQKAVIDAATEAGIHLKQVNTYEEYAALFFDSTNPEIIFEKIYNSNSDGTVNFMFQAPIGNYNNYQGWGGQRSPLYNIVDAYQTKDGKKFEMKDLQAYSVATPSMNEDGEITYIPRTIIATTENPFKNREIRFYANILYDGAYWGYGADNHPLQLFEPGEEGAETGESSPMNTTGEYWNATKTGYHLRKFMDPNFNLWESWEKGYGNTCPTIFFRLGEFYLNYAECLIELGRNEEALTYINMTRNRALLPDATGQYIREEYEQERKVELMFEGQRFFDLRRWKKMEEAFSETNWPTAMKVYKMKNGILLYTHDTSALETRVFLAPKMYWFPVPQYELDRCPNIDGKPYK